MRHTSSILMFCVAALTAVTPCAVVADGGDGATGTSGWTIVASYPLPEGASGLAWDGTDLYCGIYGADGGRIYRIDPNTGAYAPLFVGDHGDAFGLTHDGEYLWTTDHMGSSSTPAYALKLDWNGNVIDQFDLPDHYMSGIAWDDGDFWVARYYPDPGHLYKVNGLGIILDEFDGPDDQPWDLAVGEGSIWIADYWGDTLYSLDPETGSVLESHPSEGIDPAGVVWDGQYLWYCDNGDNWDDDMLYKIDLQGGGTPEIVIADPTHAFGFVALGDVVTWTVAVENTGTADLIISDVTFSPFVDLTCTASFPVVVQMGAVAQLPIDYAPTAFGPLDTTASVLSNDPVHPSELLTLTGHGVHPDPTIDIADSAHSFGQVRIGANTRWFIDVTNHGAQPLIINGATSDDAPFSIDPGLDLPVTLDTLTSMQIGVWFSPSTTATVTGTISIGSNDADQDPALVSVIGSGEDIDRPIGTSLWSHMIEGGWDNTPKAMAPIPDINGDGRTDLIVCSEDYTIRCFNGNAHGSGDVLWAHEIYSGSVYSGKGLDVVQDIDGDGLDEVVVAATGGARLIRMLSGGTGEELWTYHTDAVGDGGWVYQVDGSRDFTGDGIADVLACAGDDGDDSGPKRAYCLDGLDGSAVWQLPLGGPVYAIIAMDDFTGDGVPDAVAGASDQWETEGRAVAIDGETGLEIWNFPVDGAAVWAIASPGDITGDGIADVCVGDLYTGDVFGIDAIDGSEVYGVSGLSWLTGFQTIDDVDDDGVADIVPEHFNNFARVISGLTGATVWTTPVADNPSVAARIEDVSGDGINDVVIGTLFSNNYVYVFDGVDGTMLDSFNLGTAVDSITAIPDVVGDGSWEFVAGGRSGLVSCRSGGLDAVVFDPADINQDGVVDVVDVLLVIEYWGMAGSPADVNGDGTVDVNDILLVISAWTPDP